MILGPYLAQHGLKGLKILYHLTCKAVYLELYIVPSMYSRYYVWHWGHGSE